MKLRYLLLGVVILSACQTKKLGEGKKSNSTWEPIGQTAPPDMLFVPGNDTFPSFYVSKIEEPNINYVVYLQWLQSVYGESYPEIVREAIPKRPQGNLQYYYNDPYLQSYLTHPAFAYYPVTNLSWLQIENYLAWKTDRLNESILIKAGFLNPNPEQKDEDSFNSEAFLNYQYQGDIRALILTKYAGERNPRLSDGILFTGFRLPTEAEWDYLSRSKWNQSVPQKKGKFRRHPFGKDYYSLQWGRFYGGGQEYGTVVDAQVLNYDVDFANLPEPENLEALERAFNHLQTAATEAAVYNLEGGVREWLLDEFQSKSNAPTEDWLTVMKKGGFNVENPGIRDEKGEYVEKDFMGRMRNFRYVGMTANGRGMEIERYGREEAELDFLERRAKQLQLQVKNYPLRKSLEELETLYQERLKARIQSLQREIETEELNPYQIGKIRRELQALNGEISQGSIGYWRWNRTQKNFEELQAELLKIQQRIESLKNEQTMAGQRQRVVKGGTWKTPGNDRRAKLESEAGVDIGFRCILPYTSSPVLRKYRVKWQQKPIELR